MKHPEQHHQPEQPETPVQQMVERIMDAKLDFIEVNSAVENAQENFHFLRGSPIRRKVRLEIAQQLQEFNVVGNSMVNDATRVPVTLRSIAAGVPVFPSATHMSEEVAYNIALGLIREATQRCVDEDQSLTLQCIHTLQVDDTTISAEIGRLLENQYLEQIAQGLLRTRS